MSAGVDNPQLERAAEAVKGVLYAMSWRYTTEVGNQQCADIVAAVLASLELREEWGVQISYEDTVISDNPLEKHIAEAVVRRNHTGNAHVASRLVGPWVQETDQ